ncbi:MAG: hypothetical protein KAG82_10655 [Alcanivoracaceae bacterium]|jgi:hypothetical protein|nr:hypothetical protein [Alcanivoracaceae bacterium]
MRNIGIKGILLIALTVALASPSTAQPPTPAPITDQAQNNRPYLLVFPVLVLGIIGALVIITRKK